MENPITAEELIKKLEKENPSLAANQTGTSALGSSALGSAPALITPKKRNASQEKKIKDKLRKEIIKKFSALPNIKQNSIRQKLASIKNTENNNISILKKQLEVITKAEKQEASLKRNKNEWNEWEVIQNNNLSKAKNRKTKPPPPATELPPAAPAPPQINPQAILAPAAPEEVAARAEAPAPAPPLSPGDLEQLRLPQPVTETPKRRRSKRNKRGKREKRTKRRNNAVTNNLPNVPNSLPSLKNLPYTETPLPPPSFAYT